MFVEGWALWLWNLTSFSVVVSILSLQLQCTHKKRMDSRISQRNGNRKSPFKSTRKLTGTTQTTSVEIEEEPQVTISKAAPAQKPAFQKSTKKTLCSSNEKTDNLKMESLNSKLHALSSKQTEKTTTAEEEGKFEDNSTDRRASEDTDLRTPIWMQSAPMPIFKNGAFVAFKQSTNKETIKSKDDLFDSGKQQNKEDEEVSSQKQLLNSQLAENHQPQRSLKMRGHLIVEETEDESVFLLSCGKKYKLDIGALNSFAYYNGMLATFEGMFTSPDSFTASSYCPQPMISLAKVGETHDSLRFMVISGLMLGCTKEDEAKKRIDWVVKTGFRSNIHALILSGPFAVRNNDSTFDKRTQSNLELLLKKLSLEVLHVFIVPNYLYDLTGKNRFPTRAMSFVDTGAATRRPLKPHFVTDPAVFEVNGVRFGVTNSEPLVSLYNDEQIQGDNSSDRTERWCGHLLDQRSLCLTTSNSSFSDYGERFLPHLTKRPHFIIATCHRDTFKKVVQNVVFVNPKFCAKNVCRGAIVNVDLRAARENKNSDGELDLFNFSSFELLNKTM